MSEAALRLDGWRGLALVCALVAAVAWPLLTYTLTLAAFGLVHVLAELRYVDRRFGGRVRSRLGVGLGVGLTALVAVRLASNVELVSGASALVLELAIGVGLVALVLPVLGRERPGARWIGVGVAASLGLGILVSPVHALLLVAVLHNLTPLGFVAERAPAGRRWRVLGPALVVFVVVPLIVATGLPWRAVAFAGVAAPELGVGFEGALAEHMRAFLPADWVGTTVALHAFSACAFLQCAHYLYVIDVLPRSMPRDAPTQLPWPRVFWPVLVGAALLSLAVFASADFFAARRWYGVAAALHAWVELPILLLALAPRRPS